MIGVYDFGLSFGVFVSICSCFRCFVLANLVSSVSCIYCSILFRAMRRL